MAITKGERGRSSRDDGHHRARVVGAGTVMGRFRLLVIDEIGYLSYDARNADLLFQVVSRRYEKKPMF
jgi:hypothetical protein